VPDGTEPDGTKRSRSVSSDVAEQCLGHVLPGLVRQTYDHHDYLQEKAEAFEALAAQIEQIVKGEPTDKVIRPKFGRR
jgi:hypothetical protein